ncbi:hypothetical protein SKAU_G00174540 [Synaphobranchus kaupii]|uniref:Uncharacterized protein n=1 Tax=Synaphobranchus kaupii TaxID=118154 RepID=A0A9Q1IYX3_SYNKA|nr:hypothetical protein SKAU_G00174540 [Synaphobranchus kaupii]
MEFPEEPADFRDPRTIRFYNESLYQTNDSVFNETDGFLPTSVKITIVVVYMVVCVVGLVGNCLVMYVIIRIEQQGPLESTTLVLEDHWI